jgi:IS605 OrfB family transposase
MKLTAKVKILHDPNQAAALKATMILANRACNYISDLAWEHKVFRQFPLHKLTYYPVREQLELTAQVVVRCISKVADAYKLDRNAKRTFKPLGAITYDSRILSYHMETSEVSIWTLAGRLKIPFVCGERQRELLQGQRGESDLVYIDGQVYLFATCDVEEPIPADLDDVLGVDLGIVNLASDSDGEIFNGKMIEQNRRIFSHRRRNLQRKQTKSAKRKLKKISGKQARFQKHTNHIISKRIVQKAQDTGRAIALEELGGIRERVTVRGRKQRARHANWSFYQLRQYIDYKAALAGVPVIFVDPRNTSRTCPVCGCVDKRNRISQSAFSCVSCGHSANADTNAAVNIAARAVVNRPMVSNL